METINEIWDQLPEENWMRLKQQLEYHQSKEDRVPNEQANELLPVVHKLEVNQVPFPQTAYQLQKILNQYNY
jgi:hypothetical protein